MKANLSLDVEDVYGDAGLLHDVLEDLCIFCEDERIYCDLYITGIKFEQLRTERPRLLAFIEQAAYLEVGYHSNTHSFHTIPVMTVGMTGEQAGSLCDYEERRFDVGSGVFSGQGGIRSMKESLTLKGFRAPNYAWTPQYLTYIRKHDLRIHTMDIPFYEPFFFMDFLHLPVVSKPLEAMLDMKEITGRLQSFTVASLFLHPSRIVYTQFWDKQRHREIHPDWKGRLALVKQIFKALSGQYELIGLRYLQDRYSAAHKTPVIREQAEELLLSAMTGKWGWSQLPKGFYNREAVELCKAAAHTFYAAEI